MSLDALTLQKRIKACLSIGSFIIHWLGRSMTSLLRLKPHCFRLDDGVGGSTQPLGKEAIADVDLDPDSLSKVEEAFISAVLF